jgi:phage terminase large subunit GpA-like protein
MSEYSNPEGIARTWRRAKEFLRPPPKYSPAEWAEDNIKIPLGNAIPGPIRFANAPYQREPLDMFANQECEQITLMWGAQLGKTQLLNCAMGYYVAHEPASQMMMQPSQGDLHTWLETKFNPMVDQNEALQDRIAKPRSREGVNNQNMKSYPGGFLMFAWAGSPRTMRGRSAPKIYCDEVDGYEYNAEGHPVSLLWQRAATFGDQRKLLVTSTPTIKGVSFVEKSFDSGDQRRFWVPCPHCNKEILLLWSQVMWEKDEEGNHLPETAYYCCQMCGSIITDSEKRMALQHGRWISEKPFLGHASYHLSELYSSFRRWRDIVRSFIEKKKTNDLQTFVNVSLAETWEEEGEQVDDHDLAERREPIVNVPDDVIVITAGVDVQDNRLEISVIGWGRDDETWTLSHETLYGDPSTPQLWTSLDSHLMQQYRTESGRDIAIRATCVDSGGHFTNSVYAFCKKNAGRRIFAIKGVGGEGKPISGRPSKNNVARCPLFPIGVDTVKDLLFARMRIKDQGAGYMHFSDKLNDEYFKQLTAEKVVTRYQRGFKKRVFEKTRQRNEALDCMVYALAAYTIIGINVNSYADRMKKQLETEEKTNNSPEKNDTITDRLVSSRRRTPQKAGFANSWR